MPKSMKDRIKSEAMAVSRITNQDLVCKDCQFRFDDKIKFGNTSTCGEYSEKPNKVLLGEPCEKYKKEVKDEDSV